MDAALIPGARLGHARAVKLAARFLREMIDVGNLIRHNTPRPGAFITRVLSMKEEAA